MTTSGEDSRLFVQSFATGLSVLDAFNAERREMSLPEIASAAGISKSAAQRFAHTLETLCMLTKDPASKRYSLSSRTLDLGYRYLQSHALLERASPYLLELNRRSGETVNLGEPAGLEMIYIGRFPSPLRSIVHMPIGRRLPMYTASAGRAYLSGLPEHEARAILEASDRVKFTPRTVTEIEPLMEMLAQAREQGYAYSNEEYYRGDLALAVPVHDVSQRVVAAVNVSVSTSDWTLASAIDQFVPLMLDTARLISTTPPSLQALSPFRIGFAGMTPL